MPGLRGELVKVRGRGGGPERRLHRPRESVKESSQLLEVSRIDPGVGCRRHTV
jgi:hypothetical protein